MESLIALIICVAGIGGAFLLGRSYGRDEAYDEALDNALRTIDEVYKEEL